MTATACIPYRTRIAAEAAGPGTGPALALDDHTFLPLDRAVTRIGRGFGADLQLDDHTVSHRHALLVSSAGGTILLDDTSSTGTFVNGRRTSRALLAPGDEITLGRVTMRFVG